MSPQPSSSSGSHAPPYLKKLSESSSVGGSASMHHLDSLQTMQGQLEVKFKGGAFSTWSDVYVRLQGRWLTMYKREHDKTRVGAVELGPGVEVTDLNDVESTQKFPRRFDVTCNGGLLPATEFIFRTRSRKERDQWVVAIATNIHLLNTVGLDMSYGIAELDHVITRMKEALSLSPIRIRSNLSLRCASGEDIVAFLVAEELAKDRAHANAMGQHFLTMNVLHHVVWEKDFADSSEQYAISDVEEETKYVVEHFQKYLDSRKFWKFFDNDGSSSVGSSARQRSTASSGGNPSMHRTSAVSSSDPSKLPAAAAAIANADKKAKKCSVCSKSFNPLRRRYYCRMCTAVVCSNCSMSRKMDCPKEGTISARICVGCKLTTMSAQDDFYDRIFSGPTASGSLSEMSASGSGASGRASTFSQASKMPAANDYGRTASGTALQRRRSNVSDASRRNSFNSTSISGLADCLSCMDEACAPLGDYFEVPYPVSDEQTDPSGRNQFIVALNLDNEAERLRSVRAIRQAIESGALTQTLNQMCSMAAIASSSPMALFGVVDSEEYIIGGKYGAATKSVIPRRMSLASHTCRHGKPLVCSDLGNDVRFRGNPWRRDALLAFFYAGIPVKLSNGHVVGALEIFDVNVRYGCVEVVEQMQTVVGGLVKKLDDIVAAAPQVAPPAKSQPDSGASRPSAAASVAPVDSLSTMTTSSSPSADDSQGPPPNEMEARLMQLLSQTTSTQEQLRNQQGHMATAINSHSKQLSALAKQLERMESTLAAKLDSKETTVQQESTTES